MMLSLLDVYNEEIEKNKQTDAEDQEDNLDATTNKINNDEDGDKDADEKALVLLQQISQDQITNPVRAIEGLLKNLSGSLRMQNRRQDLFWSRELKTIARRSKSSKLVSRHFQPCQDWCPHHKAFGFILVV
jgi:hypothetical protein